MVDMLMSDLMSLAGLKQSDLEQSWTIKQNFAYELYHNKKLGDLLHRLPRDKIVEIATELAKPNPETFNNIKKLFSNSIGE